MKNLKFENVSNKLTKEEMKVLKGGVECERSNTYTDTAITQGSTTVYQADISGTKTDSCDPK